MFINKIKYFCLKIKRNNNMNQIKIKSNFKQKIKKNLNIIN
jgi:hypothetical protein